MTNLVQYCAAFAAVFIATTIAQENPSGGPPRRPPPPPPSGPPQYQACHVGVPDEQLYYPNRKTVACFMVLDAFEILHNLLKPLTPESDPVENKIAADKLACKPVTDTLKIIAPEKDGKDDCCDLRCWCRDLADGTYVQEKSPVCGGRIFLPPPPRPLPTEAKEGGPE